MKKILSVILISVLISSFSLPVYAAEMPSQKEEVIYGILNPDGSVSNIYAVNIFNGGKITDYGSYTKVSNLTSTEKLNLSGDRITINTAAHKLYYQGTLAAKELPWNIAIKYSLNGKDIPGTELAGKSGTLKIVVNVTKNSKVSSTFFDNYALQIALKLDTKLCDNIKAEGAVIAEAGRSKQLSYTVLPGKGADINVTADVHDFEMEAITINGIKLVLDMDIDYSRFTGDIKELSTAIQKLDNGAGDLLSGVNQLSDGMTKYIEGIKAFKEGLSGLGGGIGKLDSGAVSLKNGLSELSKQNDVLVNGALAMQQAVFDTVNAQLQGNGLILPVLTPKNYSKVLKEIPGLSSIKTQLDGVVQFTKGLESYVNGVTKLGDGATDLADGTAQLKKSVSGITSPADTLYNSGVEINTAIKKLRDGLNAYKKGTYEFKGRTSDLNAQLSVKANEIISNLFGNKDEVISFVSEKNTNISSVQFVLRTGAISQPKINNIPKTEQPVKLDFWHKLLKLFR